MRRAVYPGRMQWHSHQLGFALATLLVTSATVACGGRIRPATPTAGPPTRATPAERPADENAVENADGRDGRLATYVATAYCQGTITATGTRPDDRTIAADPDVLPMGARIRVSGLDAQFKRFNRVYQVADTGANIQGRRLDIYMPDCDTAIAFGRRTVRVSVIR